MCRRCLHPLEGRLSPMCPSPLIHPAPFAWPPPSAFCPLHSLLHVWLGPGSFSVPVASLRVHRIRCQFEFRRLVLVPSPLLFLRVIFLPSLTPYPCILVVALHLFRRIYFLCYILDLRDFLLSSSLGVPLYQPVATLFCLTSTLIP